MSKSNRTDTPLRAARAQISNPEITVHAMYRSAIGIDVHLNLLLCCHQKQVAGHREQSESRDFNTDRASIDAFAAWCRECNPDIILMESTGSLWQSPYEALERAGFTSEQLALINARDAKAAAGRKTDRKDASRLASLARTGNFKKSFVPEKAFRLQRVISRDLQKNRNDISRTSNRFGKSLNLTGCRPTTVFSDIRGGKAASLILMAKLRDDPHLFDVIKQNSRRLRASPEQIMQALDFEIEPMMKEQILALRKKIDQLEEYDRSTFERLRQLQAPYEKDIQLLITITGIQERSARMIYAELCPDLKEHFPTSEQFASWLGICPGDNTSAGKQKSGKCPKGNKHLRRTLIEAARGLVVGGTAALKEKFQVLKMRRGYRRAMVAFAHLLARIIYSVLTHQKGFEPYLSTAFRDALIERAKNGVKQLLKLKGTKYVIADGLVVETKTGAILGAVVSS